MIANQATNLPTELRAKTLDSMFFTATALLGFNDLTEHLHYEMCHIAELAEKYKRLLVIVPRNHFKSSIFTITYPLWRGLRDPEETGLVVANTATNAEHFVGLIRSAFEKRPFLRQWFPELRPELSKRWNKLEACLPRDNDRAEATWEAAGWATKVTSRHYGYIVFDDLVDEETYESIELMAKLIARFEQRIKGCLRPPIDERTVIVVMNHWSNIDLACHILEKHPEFHVYYKQAIIDTPEGKKSLFPEKWKLKMLLRMQEEDPYLFATQYMNNPSDPSIMENKPEWLQKYKRGDNSIILPKDYDFEEVPIGRINIYAAGDPRHSLSNTAAEKMTSRNAISIDGIDDKGRRYHLDEYCAPSSPEEFLRAMLRLHQQWHPIRFGIESFGYQKALQPLTKIIWKDEEDKPYLELLPHDTKTSKANRIRGGYRFYALGKAFTHRFLTFHNQEFLTWDTGRFKDMGDCWAWNMHQMKEPRTKSDRFEELEADREHEESLVGMGRI